MKTVKSMILILLLLHSGCKIYKKSIKEEVRTGRISVSEVKQYKWFENEYQNYQFKTGYPDSFKILNTFKVIIIGGDWCSDTRFQLPHFIKILDKLKFPNENLDIIFVDRSKQCPHCKGVSITDFKIKFVPTFIVMDKKGSEKGRIVETPVKSLEEDLLKIINQQ